ncbi:MAG: AraC family transcriptional regulator [Spirochaetales bacterium]|nr:AraC family transcriptional regulator [Spirochaetales bacterium]
MDKRREETLREYRGRINRVMDYIDANLSEPLTLEELASVASFSKYHFHRVFFTETGETLFQFIQRLRLEKAAQLLKAQINRSVTDIAYDVGFSGPDTFARAFKGSYGVSATAWRKGNSGKTDSNEGKDSLSPTVYPQGNSEGEWKGIKNLGAEVRSLPLMPVAYVRHTGRYQGDAELFDRLFRRLHRWAGPRGLLELPDRKEIVVYHDNPGLTEDGKLRISVGTTVPPGTKVSGEVGLMEIPSGPYLLARFRPSPREYGQAWYWVFARWLPESGWQPDDRPSFEMYDPTLPADKDSRCVVDICVPLRPL